MLESPRSKSGQIVDLARQEIFSGTVEVADGKVQSIRREPVDSDQLICPGLVDAHVHIESSMLVPSEFARYALVHGTVATVSDPHEIANVCGLEGVRFMLEDAARVPLHFCFGAPPCVPATNFESSGAALGVEEVEELLNDDRIGYLSEVMNFPGVLAGDDKLLAMINIARALGKPVDGHFPGGRGEDVRKYASAGITTDHESFTIEEARDKLQAGMKILIREGSAARNFDALVTLLGEAPDRIMFCTDDCHPDTLLQGHIDMHVRRALAAGYDPLTVLSVASKNPVEHYRLPIGLLQPGDSADYIVASGFEDFRVLETYVGGMCVARGGRPLLPSQPVQPINNFRSCHVYEQDLRVGARSNRVKAIKVLDGQLITEAAPTAVTVEGGLAVSNVGQDVLKMVVLNRYSEAPPAIAFTKGFGLKSGAIASSVAHDSHNIIAVGVRDSDIAKAINLVAEHRGGISFVGEGREEVLPLPVAGLMAAGMDGEVVASRYHVLDELARGAGSSLRAPYMTLSFCALLVIPALKLSDKGLFDGNSFAFTDLFLGEE